MTRTLLQLRPGQEGQIHRVVGDGSVRQRLLDMGLLPRQRVRLERIALGGAPVWIAIGTTHLALRREEAQLIELVGEV